MKTIKSELALHEARIEASKLTKGKQIAISLMESDGDFSLVEGEQKNAYAIYKNGVPQKLSAPIEATERTVTESISKMDSQSNPKQITKTSKVPVIAVIKDEEEPEVKNQSIKSKQAVKNQSIKTKKEKVMKTNAKKASTIQNMSKAVKKQAVKEVIKKAVKKAPSKDFNRANLPPSEIIDFVQVKQRTFNEIRAMLKKGNRSDNTIKVQMGRMKNSPSLVITGEVVKFKK